MGFVEKPLIKRSFTWWARIFLAGDYACAQKALSEYTTKKGLCVTLEHADYIYTSGMERGFIVGMINYPRFPTSADELKRIALEIADLLITVCDQKSASVMMPEETIWISYRGQEN